MIQFHDEQTVRSFHGSSGCAEHYIVIEAPGELSLQRQIDAVGQRYAEALQSLRLSPDTAVFRRIYLSDIANQGALLRQSSLFQEPLDSPVAISMVQQAPLPDGKLALVAYHRQSPAPVIKRQLSPEHLLIETGELSHLWSTRLCATNVTQPGSTTEQTQEVFNRLIDTLADNGATLAGNCVRTWIYVKDVDVFYQEINDARSALFEQHGLNRDTHYIASTGIEGACAHRYDLVAMDAYSVLGLAPEQVSYLNDFERLCATRDYGVTFERGTRIAYADRAHHFISGTASIDKTGAVVHRGDVLRQLDHALGNVDALLDAGDAELGDMMHLTVYLRDPADYPRVARHLATYLPGLPTLIVQGAVCRPDWLIEVEGVAAVGADEPALPAF